MVVIRRKYKVSDDELNNIAQRLLIGANRDVAVLTPFGFGQERIDALAAMRIAFVEMPSDVELSAMMMAATKLKNDKRTEATNYVMVEIMGRVVLKFGAESAEYKRFGTSGIHNMTDASFHRLLHRVHQQASDMQEAIGEEVMTDAELEAVDALKESFLTFWDGQEKAIDNRNQAVKARVIAGNAFYAEMVKLADLGKRKWLGVDDANYNEYVIYRNQGGEPPVDQQVFETAVGSGAVVNISVTDVNGAETIVAENLGTGPLVIYFSALPTDFPPPGAGQIMGGTTEEGTATEAGFLLGEREYLNVYNLGPAPGQIKLTVIG